MATEADKAFIEKIKTLTFVVKGTPSERRVEGFRQVNSPDEVMDDTKIPDGYSFTDSAGKLVTVIHGNEDKRQVAEIVEAKQGG